LKPAERLYLIDHYLNYCQAHILHLVNEREDILARSEQINPAHAGAVALIQQHMIDQWKLELDWAKSLRQQELAQAEGIEEKGVHPYATE
jgi:hypothetical protein